MRQILNVSFLTFGLALCLLVHPAQASDRTVRLGRLNQTQIDQQLRIAVGHPNEFWRYHGLRQHLSDRDGEAARYFERAAGFADKTSQHYLSLLYWYGQGVSQDRVLAYIWSDLAAERGQRSLLRIREKMWHELTEAERAQVIERGEAMHRKYADAYTKVRAERALFRFATQMTGSKVGFNDQPLAVQFGGPINGSFGNATPGMLAASEAVNGGASVSDMYGDKRVDRRAYWQAQDRMLEGPLRATVNVGPIEPVDRPR